MPLSILIIEDVPEDALAIERQLRDDSLEFTSRRVETRDAFLNELHSQKPDVILSDFTLPEFNALEALALAQDQAPDIPFILVTGTRSEEVAVECLRQGADDYILKASLKRLPASMQSVLEKKQAELALRRSEEQFRLIAEHSRDLICIVDTGARFLYVSPAFSPGLGYLPQKLAGSDLYELIHPADRESFQSVWEAAIHDHGPYTAEFRARHANGDWRVLEASGNWIFNERNQPQRSVIVSRDITLRKQSEDALRGLPAFIRDAQESERRRVARELHDSVIQILSSVRFRFQSVEEHLMDQEETVQVEAAKAASLLENAIHETRRISQNLRPSELDDLGLAAAVRSLSKDFQERTGVPVTLALEAAPEPLSKESELHIYRVLQEALANIEQHSGAGQVRIRFQKDASTLQIEVQDNGCGFNVVTSRERTADGRGMGLVDIRERTKLAGGTCFWESEPGSGTRLHLHIPLPAAGREHTDDKDKT